VGKNFGLETPADAGLKKVRIGQKTVGRRRCGRLLTVRLVPERLPLRLLLS